MLNNFLSQRTKKNVSNFVSTHTRMPDKELNIFGGSFCIPETDLINFWNLYYEDVFVKGNSSYLTEKQLPYGACLAVDLDFRYTYETTCRQHTKNDIDDIICLYLECIKKFYVVDPNIEFDIFVFEKPNVNRLEDASLTKDGIHIIFGLQVYFEIQQKIREIVMNEIPDILTLPLINTWESVFDEGISKGTTNWTLYGSKKPHNEAYKLTYHYVAQLDDCDEEFMLKELNITDFDLKTNFPKLSVQYPNNPKFVAKEIKETKQTKQRKKSPTSITHDTDETDEETTTDAVVNKKEFEDILDMIIVDEKLKKTRKVWLAICACIKHNGLDENVWLKFMKNKLNADTEKENLFKYLIPDPIPFDYIKGLAYKTNAVEYIEYYKDIDGVKTTKRVANNDDDAGDLLFKDLKDILKSDCYGRIFYKHENIWIYDEKTIKDIIIEYIFKSRIYSINGFGDWVEVCKSLRTANTFYETLMLKIRNKNQDKELYNKFHNNTNKLCFNDGVLDFKDKNFLTWKELKEQKKEIYTTFKIKKDFKPFFENPDRKLMEDIKRDVFETAYGDKTNLILQFLSRAITGNREDKRFATYLGNRNSGKGVEYDLLKYAFEDYVATFELGNVLYCRRTAGMENLDCSKRLYWLLDLEFVRLAISQEIPETNSGLIVNGKMWKKVTGGGDTIVARRNYDRKDTHFTIDTTFYVKGNNTLLFDAEDCSDTQLEFNSVIQFKTEDEINFIKQKKEEKIKNMMKEEIDKQLELDALEMKRYKKADDTIKQKSKVLNWSLATIMLIYENYVNEKISIVKEIHEESNVLIDLIHEHFIITNKVDDCELCADVYAYLSKEDKKKINNELLSLNVFKKQNNKAGKYRNKLCFFGIKKKEEKEDC